MCGICGQYRFEGRAPVDRATIEAMCATLHHRGPDDRGVYTAGPIGLGATRLAIIDPEGGHQPRSNEDGTIWAVQNGEIYNYRALQTELEAQGHRFASHSDTEVLVHLYEQEGLEFVHRLRGMFALAVWDGRARRLVLARDRLGIKPLFYTASGSELVFGSEIKALLAAGVPRRLDPLALDDYLSLDYVPGPRTMFDGIARLQGGHLLVAEATGRVEVTRYWDLPLEEETPAAADEETLAGLLRQKLEEAVAAHLVSDVPVGAFLSGGLDSSVVVALMARLANGPVATFSVGFRERSYNELPYARRVAAHCGTDHHEFTVEPHIEEVIDHLVDAFDEPFADSSAVATYYLAQVAADHTKVVLSGDGGDEVFGGYVIYHADRLAQFYRRLPAIIGGRLIPRLARLLPASEGKMSWDLKIRRFVANAGRDPLAAHIGWRAIFSPEMKRQLYAADFWERHRDQLANGHRVFEVPRALFDAYPGADLLNRLMYVDTRLSLADDMLTKVDRTSMAHSLEVRVPLLDHHLVAWMATLPSRYKVRRLTLKVLLRRVAADLLPPDIVARPKAGFHIPLPGWLKHELRPLVERQLGEPTVVRQGVFDPAYVRHLLEAHYAGRENYSRNLWGLLMFGLWYDRCL